MWAMETAEKMSTVVPGMAARSMINALAVAINSADDIPCPETSPTTTASRSSLTFIKSY